MAGGEGDVPLTYDGAPGTDFLVTADGGADSIVGYTTGQIGRFEQLGEWTIMDVANSVGIYLDEGSFIKIKRQMCYLPPVDMGSGWLSTNHYFGFDSKVQKYIFGDSDGSSSSATEVSNSPGYVGRYEDWEAWYNDPAGYAARATTGYYQYLDFYDYHDRYFGRPVSSDGYPTETPGLMLSYNRDDNQLLRYNKVTYAYRDDHFFGGYPVVDANTTHAINNSLESAYSTDEGDSSFTYEWISAFTPNIAGSLPGTTDGTPAFTSSVYDVLFGAEYETFTTWCTYFTYAYADLSAAITTRYRTPEMASIKMESVIKSLAAEAATQKISSSSKFSENKQVAKKFSKNSLSAIVRGAPSITQMGDATISTSDPEMFTYDTEGGADMPEGGADDYSY